MTQLAGAGDGLLVVQDFRIVLSHFQRLGHFIHAVGIGADAGAAVEGLHPALETGGMVEHVGHEPDHEQDRYP
ncbi:hypothetical protein D3C71_2125790 [compost metagenome]